MKKLLLLLLCVPLIGFGQTKQELKEQLNKKLSEVSNEINKSTERAIQNISNRLKKILIND